MSVLAHLAQASNYYGDYYDSYDYSATDATAAVVFGGVFLVFVLILAVLGYVIHAFLLGRVFKKAGIEQWIAWVPFYNSWKLLELGGQQGFWAVLAIVPVVNIVSAVFVIIAMYHIGLKLGKEGWFVLLAIFIPTLWLIWLAFDDSKWDNSKDAPALIPTKDTKAKTTKKEA